MTLNLPPPVIFNHKETLHAIELPPLATFLSTLSIPEHLLKLNDILLRYRTPKSYHRVDVREVTSSELPLSSPEPEDAESRREKVEDKGEPVILGEGDTVEQYRARQDAGPPKAAEEAPAQNGHISPSTQREATAASHGETSTQNDSIPTDTLLTSTAIDQNERRSKSPTPPTTVRPPTRTPTTPSHTLPPTGPKRRIRELRLDLRTLDAAALFALETWRRELMGLEKLGMEHPDSIWYKDPTPTPTPTPSPEPVKRKPGRPPRRSVGKSQSKTPVMEADEEEKEVSGTGLEVKGLENVIEDENAGSRRRRPPRRSAGKSQSKTSAVEADDEEKEVSGADLEVKAVEDVEADENVQLAEDMDPAGSLDDDHMLDGEAGPVGLGRSGSIEQEDIQDVEAFDILVDGSANDNEEAVLTKESAECEIHNPSPIQVDELESSPHPASPDIITMDGFNRNDNDSDFSPERSPSPILKRSRPSRNAPQSSFPTTSPPTVMRSTVFQAAPPPAAMRINAAPPPVASGCSAPHRAPKPPTTGASATWFQDAPPPQQLGSSSRTSDNENQTSNVQPTPSSRTVPGRPLSLSPTRPPIPIPIQRRPVQEGGTSDSPFEVPDSPEKRSRNSAFVPFVREQMRIPVFKNAPVVPAKGLHWHESEKSRANGRKRKEIVKEREALDSRPKARRRSSITKVHFAEEEDEVVEDVDTNRKQGRKRRAGDSDDDEWADFRF